MCFETYLQFIFIKYSAKIPTLQTLSIIRKLIDTT